MAGPTRPKKSPSPTQLDALLGQARTEKITPFKLGRTRKPGLTSFQAGLGLGFTEILSGRAGLRLRILGLSPTRPGPRSEQVDMGAIPFSYTIKMKIW
jgi:hypothetical protein